MRPSDPDDAHGSDEPLEPANAAPVTSTPDASASASGELPAASSDWRRGLGPKLAAVGIAVVVVAAGVLAALLGGGRSASVAVASPSPTGTVVPSSTVAQTLAPTDRPTPAPTPTPTPRPNRLLGADGRFTILLLGSDHRTGHAGHRTDTMMVVSVDPTSGAVAAASVPRDTVGFPLPDGDTYTPKLNGLYQSYAGRIGATKAGREMKRAFGSALGVEIDYYALIGFEGVRQLVDAVGGVDVWLDETVHDPQYWITSTRRGVTFPAGSNHLDGDLALVFARTRKGDNDYDRARRQQRLVGAAVAAVRDRGLANLPALVDAGRRWVKTDVPLGLARDVFDIAMKADLEHPEQVVFGPRTWATSTGGTSFTLKMDAVRGWIAERMAPIATVTE